MSESKAVSKVENRELQAQQEQRRSERYLRPPVDIWEDSKGITVKADLPGVSPERLDLQVDSNNLIIEGEVQVPMSEDMKALYADLNVTRYRRSFTLSQELDTEQIEAALKNGELTLFLPKKAELQPRKIDIKTAA